MKFCEKCGKELLEGVNFCEGCGAKLENIEEKSDIDSAQEVEIIETPQEENFANNGIKRNLKVNVFSKTFLIIAAAVVAVIVLIVIVFSNKGPNFKKLYKEYCISTWAEVGEDGSYLSLDTNPFDLDDSGIAYSAAYYAIEDINKELNLPDSLFKDMGATTGADGKQTEEFEKVIVSWKYHPDSGLEVVYRKR